MPIEILMPALSPTMESGNLAKWLVKEGDSVAPGDIIAEIETDKATMEVEAVDEGTVGKIVVDEGTSDVPVNQLIALLLEEGEDESALDGAADKAAPKKDAKPEKAEAPKTDEKPEQKTEDKTAEPKKPAPAEAPAEAGPAPTTGDGDRIFSSPLARRIARQNDLDLSAVKGSGPHGRIIQRDVEEALEKGTAAAKPEKAAAAAPAAAPAKGMGADAVRAMFEEGSYETVPHDSMRKVIARRLTESKTTIPHFYLTIDCRIDALLALRKQLNDAAPVTDDKPAYKISVNDMVIKALALSLKAVPDANVTWTDEAMLKHKAADVGVAVAIPGGLITPVVRRADEKTLSVISNEMKDFAKRARDRRLKPEEYQGGATAVSNLGMFGIKDFSAVINPPHATILAVGAGEQRPVVTDGSIEVATIMSATLSTDHRAVDGALGAELMAAFKRYIENPMGMLV
ncbi:pyruvate dehydrogenase E2 component (dihydrolipoamide acetyltransferase) [Rhodobium orientis]|uniref:Acetyltransferase component of pyruvate dehydrogenase complex n=1 Tax=Rhodobium orientis TaxID=34017 RepID=A0A327JQ94_9HYPH|nr:pyruvate dehydrogenase complex dihydrolipoamide acetyltransferase [Rhodobium orientis]MBB4302460.1 pyruvate dehydrogenase E2 component (dihydrolipoamide acetyltransferase) [Rhodobium orientis]MBK5949309.1 pyruvate dehydrogenase complex dihydrolipoamide acetyltransferase [Rhodobium orientis]RAI28640.1 pyruvate dehydrogenase complex dihydrolipoamide acetyltransferase [Rhodobium orientis]